MQKCIYVADDQEHIRTLIQMFLINEGYEVAVFPDGEQLMEAFLEREPDLIVLDIMMPGQDGLSICTNIRRTSSVPIIIVSAKDSPLDRVAGITLGSDDYLVKPFLPLELTARVKALLRRADITKSLAEDGKAEILGCGNLTLDACSRIVSSNGRPFAVTPTEFDFLNYMMERQGKAVSKKELLEKVWGCTDSLRDTRMADDLVKRLRKKLKEAEVEAALETVWGYGFRITRGQKEEKP